MAEIILNIEQQQGIINFNSEELKKELALKMEEYKGAVVTKDSEAIVKKEVASLRSLVKEIDSRRIEIKNKSMEPYSHFEAEVKEIIKIINEPINYLDSQLKEIEQLRIKGKRKVINNLYEEAFAGLSIKEFVPLAEIYDHKWENKGTSTKTIKEDMQAVIDKTKADLDILESNMSDVKEEAIKKYKANRDLTNALTFINQYESSKKRALELEERRRKEELEREKELEIQKVREEERKRLAELEEARMEERAKVEAEKKTLELTEKEVQIESNIGPFIQSDEVDDLPFSQPDTVIALYKIIATQEELEQVEMAFHSIGIEFERREC